MVKVTNIRGRGRGVVATKRIRKGQLVETSPVIVVSRAYGELVHYDFAFGKRAAIALGVGSLFNHSAHPNLFIATSIRRREISFFARRQIARGEELTFDYGYAPRGYDGK